MTLTETRSTTPDCAAPLELFRALNDDRVPSTDPRRLAIAGEMFPAARVGATLDDGQAALRLLAAVIRIP